MFVRRTRVESSPDKLEQMIRNCEQLLLPEIKQEMGFRGAVLLANSLTGAAQSVTLWENEAAERGSRVAGERLRAQAVQDSGARVVDVESYEEVVHQRRNADQPLAAASFIRFNSLQAAPDKLEDGIRFVREQVVPLLQQQSGFLAVIMGVNRESGRVYVTTSWETAAARQASDMALRDQRRTAGELMGGNQVSVEEYEVVFIELAEPVAATPT
jgi:heme-degrading monooxygenase HmoA